MEKKNLLQMDLACIKASIPTLTCNSSKYFISSLSFTFILINVIVPLRLKTKKKKKKENKIKTKEERERLKKVLHLISAIPLFLSDFSTMS